MSRPRLPYRADSVPGVQSNRYFVCNLRMWASACQLVPDASVRIPCPERSSPKTPCRQVNERPSRSNP
jgi:hypothetical protein